jgi:hypothetical protein
MAGNSDPIYSKVGDIQWSGTSALFTSAMTAGNVSSYDGTDANVKQIFSADATNGGFVQRVRAKCCGLTGTSAASVLRIWINNGSTNATAVNNVLVGEVGLPAVANTIVAATPDVELTLNIALPAGYKLYAGLGTAVTTGWAVTAIGGKY